MSLNNILILNQITEHPAYRQYKCKIDFDPYLLYQFDTKHFKKSDASNIISKIEDRFEIKSKFLVRQKTSFYDYSTDSICVVTDYATMGSLRSQIKLRKEQKTTFSDEEILKITKMLAKGLLTVHRCSSRVLGFDSKAVLCFDDDTVRMNLFNRKFCEKIGLFPKAKNVSEIDDKEEDLISLGKVIYELVFLREYSETKGIVFNNNYSLLVNKVMNNLLKLDNCQVPNLEIILEILSTGPTVVFKKVPRKERPKSIFEMTYVTEQNLKFELASRPVVGKRQCFSTLFKGKQKLSRFENNQSDYSLINWQKKSIKEKVKKTSKFGLNFKVLEIIEEPGRKWRSSEVTKKRAKSTILPTLAMRTNNTVSSFLLK